MSKTKMSVEYWYLARKLEQRMIGHCEGKIKNKKKLKNLLIQKQNNKCGLGCDRPLGGQIEVDRIETQWNFDPNKNFGYFEENCRAVHADCHRKESKKYDSWSVPEWLEANKEHLFNEVKKLLCHFSMKHGQEG